MNSGYQLPMTDAFLNRLVRDLGADRKATRMDACTTLIQYPEKNVVRRLVKELGNSNSNVRGNAAFILGRIGDSLAEKDLIALLKDDNVGGRINACMALGDVGGMESAGILMEFVNDRVLGKHAKEAMDNIWERQKAKRGKINDSKARILAMSKESIIRERGEFMQKVDELIDRMRQLRRNDPPEKKAIRKKPRRHLS